MVLELTKQLINQQSVTPEDQDCQKIIADRLEKLGFTITHLPFGPVKNLWAYKNKPGHASPLFIFLGHTDVVPPGLLDQWDTDPFHATEKNGFLYGRGAQDMKSNIAAMITAYENFITHYPNHTDTLSLGFLITSDEEGPSIDGTQKVIDYLNTHNITINYCLVGEPSSVKKIGDMIKIGRRGTLSAELIIKGKQGHIAYPHLSDNAIHKAIPLIQDLLNTQWDNGAEFFEKTSFQISNLSAGTGVGNIIPGELTLRCNFRYNPSSTDQTLKNNFIAILHKYISPEFYHLNWHHSGKPFLSQSGKLVKNTVSIIENYLNVTPTVSTSGGTSDGRFIAPFCPEIIELGVCNDTIHQVNERVAISELTLLSELYEKILISLL